MSSSDSKTPSWFNAETGIYSSPLGNVDIPSGKTVTQYVLEGFTGDLDSVAMVNGDNGQQFTYRELHKNIKSTAAAFHKRGYKKGDVVVVVANNCPEWAFIFHGLAMIGCVISGANPRYTVEELTFQYKDADAISVVADADTLAAAQAAAANCPNIKEIIVVGVTEVQESATPPLVKFSTFLEDDGKDLPDAKIDPDNDLVVLPYSSGTTGLPKGVMLTHQNLIANLAQIQHEQLLNLKTTDSLIAVLPFYHIYGLVVILNCALVRGASVVTIPKFDAPKFLTLLSKYKVTIAHLVPPIVVFMAKHPVVAKFDLTHLQEIFSGAAPLDAHVGNSVKERLNLKVVRQGYGMTEMSPASHITPIASSKTGSCGVLVPNCECKVIDVSTGKAVGIGQQGEIWIRGPNIMKGYHKNPDATANTVDSDGYIHTGDIGYVDEEGACFIVDRLKELIKFKGFQVAPAELEAVLLKHPAIADAAVIPRPDEEAGEIPKAYVVLQPNAQATAEEIMSFVSEHVAPFKRIKLVEFIAAIPKTPSGKILRKELRALDKETMAKEQAAGTGPAALGSPTGPTSP